jgi:hypothetical protein
MLNYSTENFSNKEYIAILFKEYDTLRAELISRTVGGFQLISIIAVLSTALLAWGGSHPGSKVLWGGIGVLCVAAGLFFYIAYRDTNLLARRIREIESEINGLAGDRELLKWETHFGASVTGWIIRRQRIGSSNPNEMRNSTAEPPLPKRRSE